MQDLDKALADIGSIRQQLAAGTMFRGLGPAVIAITGVLAAATATAQSIWLTDATQQPLVFLAGWAATALASAALIGAEMIARTRDADAREIGSEVPAAFTHSVASHAVGGEHVFAGAGIAPRWAFWSRCGHRLQIGEDAPDIHVRRPGRRKCGHFGAGYSVVNG